MKHIFCTICIVTLFGISVLAQEANWNQWRGPKSDNHSASTGIAKSWPAGGPKLLWKVDNLGSDTAGGFASVSFYGDKLFTMNDINNEAYVFALDRNTGKEIWKTAIGRGGDGGGGHRGTLSTPACDGETVYAKTQHGEFVALDVKDGSVRWRKDLVGDFGARKMSQWGYSSSPMIDGDKIVLPIGGEGGTLAAFSKSGELLWRTSELKDPVTHSSAVPVEIAGVRQYLLLTGSTGGGRGGRGGRGGGDAPAAPVDPGTSAKIAGISPTDGKVLWQAPFRGVVALASDPVLIGDVVMVASGYNIGADFYRITKTGNDFKAEKFLEDESLLSHHGGIVAVGDHFYLLSDRKGLTCVEAKTGKIVWENRSVGKGSLTYVDGMFILRSEAGDGTIALAEATPEGYKELGRFDQPDRSDKNSWAYPVVFGNKLYIRDQNVLLCYDLN